MVQTAALSLWSHYLTHGWEETYRLLKQKLDVEGETSAYTVLGLEPGAPNHPAGRRRRFVLVVDRQNNPSELCLLRESRLRKALA